MTEIKLTENGYDRKYEKGMRRELVLVMLTCGVVSYDGLHMLTDDHEHRMYTRTLRKMSEEGLVNVVRYGNKKMARLTDVKGNCCRYIREDERELYEYYMKYADGYAKLSGRYKSDPQGCKRALIGSETTLFMHGSGISCLSENKPAVGNGEIIPDAGAYYYNAIELKGISSYTPNVKTDERRTKTVLNSRAIGCMTSGENNYLVYNIQDKLIKWSQISEMQFSMALGILLGKAKERKTVGSQIEACIILYKKTDTLIRAFRYTDEKQRSYINADTGYRQTYYLPYDENGRAIARIMCMPKWKETLKRKYLGNIEQNTSSLSVTCDGVETNSNGKIYYLLYCIPDVTKLYRFLKAAEWNGNMENFVIYCYSYQTEFLKSIASGLAQVYETKIDEEIF